MKKKFQGWRKKVAVGLLAAALCGSLSAQTAMATMHYDRRQTVAQEQFESSADTYSASASAAMQKGLAEDQRQMLQMEAEKSFQGPSPEESMCPNGRKPSTGRK